MKKTILSLVFLAIAAPALLGQNNAVQTTGGPDSMTVSDDINICRGTSIHLSVHRVSGAIAYFVWSPMNTLTPLAPGNDSEMVASPLVQSTSYFVTAYHADASVAFVDSVHVYQLPTPSISVTSDTTIASGQPLTLTGYSNGIFLEWKLGNDTLAYDSSSGFRSLTMTDNSPSSGDYLFIARGLSGWKWCADTAVVAVTIEDPGSGICDATLYVPNTFTPDGDGSNEAFFASGTNIEDFHMMIFDRWGRLLFETHDIGYGWDGTYKGRAVEIDTYVYAIDYAKCGVRQRPEIGHVNVIR